ncbi:MAG TPA: DUF1326 domain-containing protein [Bryobacteraceae bacterium]|nr:DUF1326 domain-containing protein [Bryobacteraceae bacterium]
MKHLLRKVSFALTVPALSFAGSLAVTNLRGDYVESRTADVYTGPCFANGEANQVGDLAVFGWSIEKGTWQGVELDGLSGVGVVKASGTLGVDETVYPVKSVLIIDERANPEQRLALKSFAQRMGGDLLQHIVRVEYQPIIFKLRDNNPHTATAVVNAGVARIETRAITGADDICHNEETFYPPLTRVDHAMPAYTLANRFDGNGLGTKWSSPGKRSSFVGTFHLTD